MKDGFKASFIGFILAVALGVLFILIAKWFALNYLNKRLDAYFLTLIGIVGAIIGYSFRITALFITKRFDKMDMKIENKSDRTYVEERIESIKMYIDDHKENNQMQFDQLHESITSIDNKLDILIGRKK